MPPRGRKPTPTETKKRTGNPGKRALNDREPTATPGAPDMPDHLDADAAVAWEWLCGELDKLGLLVTSDVAVMAVYCDSWSGYRRNLRGVVKYGDVLVGEKGVPFLSAYGNAVAMHRKALMSAAVEMGLSASSRSRVQAIPQVADDPLMALIKSRNEAFGGKN